MVTGVRSGSTRQRKGIREALCTLGNGYLATRAAAAGAVADDVHYPGTYLAGGYNRLRTEIAGRVVQNKIYRRFFQIPLLLTDRELG